MKAARLVLIVTVIGYSIVALAAGPPNSQLPSLSELKRLKFVAEANASGSFSFYPEVINAQEMFRAYSVQAKTVSQYKEPIPTRGATGETLFRNCSPAVVAVVVGSFDNSDNFNPEGLGTGAIVDSRGYILTNWHVINGHVGAIIFLKPGRGADLDKARAYGAKVICQNPTIDLALLKIIDAPAGLGALKPGDMSQIQVAEDIHIIGHPHGNFWSYSTGVVSQIRNNYTWKYSDGSEHEAKVLQLQTAINPGNSGGPVLDDSGEILGLVAMSEEGQNLDYAIAVDVIKDFLFLGMHAATRSVEMLPQGPSPSEIGVSTLSDGRKIWKMAFPKAEIYIVRDRSGNEQGILASFSNGLLLNGWWPDSDGHFRLWSATTPNRPGLVATATAGILKEISQSAGH
jgi:S1-C subfamily serine protease